MHLHLGLYLCSGPPLFLFQDESAVRGSLRQIAQLNQLFLQPADLGTVKDGSGVWRFDGWYDGSGTAWDQLTAGKDVTLRAKWTRLVDEISLTYDIPHVGDSGSGLVALTAPADASYKVIEAMLYDENYNTVTAIASADELILGFKVVLTGEERRNMYEKHFEPYWSDFPAMLFILFENYENTLEPECASCFASYELFHKPDMDPKEFGLENFLDDGQSWAEGVFVREEFKDICICHAVHELCQHKMYSIPDLLRMNDFWCEVKVTHQLLSDRDGKRFSYIERKGGE